MRYNQYIYKTRKEGNTFNI